MATNDQQSKTSGLTTAYLTALNAAAPGVSLLSTVGNLLNPAVSQPAASTNPADKGVVTQTSGNINLSPRANLQAVAEAQRQYAQGVQAGTIPAQTSQGGPAFPSLTNTFPTGELYPGQNATELKLRAFDQTQAQAATPAQATSAINADLTNALLRTALGQTTQQPGAGIDFGAGDLARQNAAVANPFAQQFNNLLGQVTALANTTPSGSDSFVDYFNKAAARKRGQEGLVKLAELAGQATSAQAGQQLQAQTEQARLQQAGQEAQQRNALLAGQTLLQTQTSLAEKNAALEAAKAKAAAEAPKTQAETAKAQAEAEKAQLLSTLGNAILRGQLTGQPVPQNILNTYQGLATGQFPVTPKPTIVKTLTDKGEVLNVFNPQGQIQAQGTGEQLLERQQAAQALSAAPGQPYRSALNPSLVYYIDPTTKTMTSGTLQQYAAAVGGK